MVSKKRRESERREHEQWMKKGAHHVVGNEEMDGCDLISWPTKGNVGSKYGIHNGKERERVDPT